MRTFFVLSLILLMAMTCQGAPAMDPIPEGTHLVIFLGNFSQLPLSDLIRQNPFIRPKDREGLENFIKASGFNVFSDINSVQIFSSLEEEKKVGAALLKGKFDTEKLAAWVKLILGEKLEQITENGQTILTDKQSKMLGVCFFDTSTILFGFVPTMQKVLECRKSGKSAPAFAEMLGKINDKAYVAVLFSGRDIMSKQISRVGEKLKSGKPQRRPEAFMKEYLFGQLLEGLSLNYLVSQRIEDRGEIWINYDRGEQKNVGLHLLFETTDQKLFVSEFFKMLAAGLTQIPQDPPPGAGAPEPPNRQ